MSVADAAPLIDVKALTKVFPHHGVGGGGRETVAVNELTFTVKQGDSLAVIGESGSGKTTLARLLLGIERPTAGTIMIDGRDCSKPSRGRAERLRRARQMQIVFQDPYRSLDARQSIASCLSEVLRLHSKRSRAEREKRIDELLELVGLDSHHRSSRPHALSGGQQQRVAIARALAVEPRILILDEAVAALDVSIQAQILNLLADIRQETEVTYLFISHDLAVVSHVSDNALVMRRGTVVERGPTREILDNPQDPYTQLLRSCVPRPGWQPRRQLAALEAAERNGTVQTKTI
jgi:oligopeptide transport system ATP-binding protein